MHRPLFLIAFLLTSTLAVVGHAQKSTQAATTATIRQELSDEARRSWDSAIELFEARDYQGARVEFMRAFELSNNPRVLFNVGVCDKNLRRYARAVEVWRQQLEQGAASVPEHEAAAARAAIETVAPFVTSLRVEANIEGAALFIDEEQVGKTPFAGPLPIDVGRHSVRLRKQGYRDQVLDITAGSGRTEQARFELEPEVRTALVTVQVTNATGATIFINGVDMGPAPFRGQLPVGRHTIEARAPGHVTARQTSDVRWKNPLSVALSLAEQRHEGRVQIKVSEPDALILIDGTVVGEGAYNAVLSAGGHQLEVRKGGFVTYTTDLALSDGQVRTVSVPLRREERGASWVWWTVGSAALVAGGAVATYFITRPTEEAPVTGTWSPGLVSVGSR